MSRRAEHLLKPAQYVIRQWTCTRKMQKQLLAAWEGQLVEHLLEVLYSILSYPQTLQHSEFQTSLGC